MLWKQCPRREKKKEKKMIKIIRAGRCGTPCIVTLLMIRIFKFNFRLLFCETPEQVLRVRRNVVTHIRMVSRTPPTSRPEEITIRAQTNIIRRLTVQNVRRRISARVCFCGLLWASSEHDAHEPIENLVPRGQRDAQIVFGRSWLRGRSTCVLRVTEMAFPCYSIVGKNA